MIALNSVQRLRSTYVAARARGACILLGAVDELVLVRAIERAPDACVCPESFAVLVEHLGACRASFGVLSADERWPELATRSWQRARRGRGHTYLGVIKVGLGSHLLHVLERSPIRLALELLRRVDRGHRAGDRLHTRAQPVRICKCIFNTRATSTRHAEHKLRLLDIANVCIRGWRLSRCV